MVSEEPGHQIQNNGQGGSRESDRHFFNLFISLYILFYGLGHINFFLPSFMFSGVSLYLLCYYFTWVQTISLARFSPKTFLTCNDPLLLSFCINGSTCIFHLHFFHLSNNVYKKCAWPLLIIALVSLQFVCSSLNKF